MLKYCLILLTFVLMLTDITATKTKPQLPDEVKVLHIIQKKIKKLGIKDMKKAPFDVVAQTTRQYLEKKVGDPAEVTDDQYMALFQKVVTKILSDESTNNE